MQSVMAITRFSGDGGSNKQKIFLKDTEIGWKKIFNNASLHQSVGQSQYEYLEFVGERTDGEGRKCLDNHLGGWN